MKTKITKTFIRKVLSMRKEERRDLQEAHPESAEAVAAVLYADRMIARSGFQCDLDAVKEEAEKWLETMA